MNRKRQPVGPAHHLERQERYHEATTGREEKNSRMEYKGYDLNHDEDDE